MAPEQWHGAPVSPATDVYAAACVFFECVTGGLTYGSSDTTTLRRMHESAPVPANAVPEPLRPLVAHGMAKDPAHRPPGAQQFVAQLERLAAGAYGPDWERRGWIALGTATAVLAAAFPAAALGMTTGATTALGHGFAQLAGRRLPLPGPGERIPQAAGHRIRQRARDRGKGVSGPHPLRHGDVRLHRGHGGYVHVHRSAEHPSGEIPPVPDRASSYREDLHRGIEDGTDQPCVGRTPV
jgi:hypothetical protein